MCLYLVNMGTEARFLHFCLEDDNLIFEDDIREHF